MDAVGSILAATDFSASSGHAVRRAALLAAEQTAELSVLHVMSDSALKAARGLYRSREQAEAGLGADAHLQMSELVASLPADATIPTTARVKTGDVEEEIVIAAEAADLLVMGAHGASGLRDVILGTTADRVLRHSRGPILVVKCPPVSSYGRVLVAIGYGPASASLIQLAVILAPRAETTLFHASSVPFENRIRQAGVGEEDIEKYRAEARRGALEHIDSLVGRTGVSPLAFRRRVVHGDASRLILDEEAGMGADLIIVGKHGNSVLERALLGSVTRHVLGGSRCDVLVVSSRLGEAG